MSIYWLAFSVLIWGLLHSVFASLQFKTFAQRSFGLLFDRFYRLLYNLFAGITLMGVLMVAALTPDRNIYIIPFPWVLLMVIIEFLAIAALVAAFKQTDVLDFIGLRQVSGSESKKSAILVKGGLYRYVRHPLYTAGLLFIWTLPLMTERVLVIDLGLTIYVIAGAYFEERKLRNEFGLDYANYAAVTPMFIPFLKKMRKRDAN